MSKQDGWEKASRAVGGVKDTARGLLEGLWDMFVHHRLARMLGVGAIFIAMGAQVACQNALPYNGPTETTPLPSGVGITSTGEVVPTNTENRLIDTALPTSEVPQIDPTPAAYPNPDVQKSFENGDYETAQDKMQEWVALWEKMDIVSNRNIGSPGSTLNPVPLAGEAKLICLDTRGNGPYAGMLLCEPLDLVNGGVRSLPTGEPDQFADRPLFLTIAPGCTLTTVGSGNQLVYQEVGPDGQPTRFVNPQTGHWVEGAAGVVESSEVLAARVEAFLNRSAGYSDEELSKKLYAPDYTTAKINELGFVKGGAPSMVVQEVLLGGKVKGDYVYFILGTQDKAKNRFVHIGVFPITYAGMEMELWLQYVDKLIYTGAVDRTETISGSQELQDFLDTHKGVGVLAHMMYGKLPADITEGLDEKSKALFQFGELTDVKAEGIANRLYVLHSPVGTSNPGIGTDEGIYTSAKPLTAEEIDNLDFDPAKMVAVPVFDLRSK